MLARAVGRRGMESHSLVGTEFQFYKVKRVPWKDSGGIGTVVVLGQCECT